MPSPQTAAHGAGKSVSCMPNIELHGFETVLVRGVRDAVLGMACPGGIKAHLCEDLVVTITQSDVENGHGRKAPFVRVFYETLREREDCLEILKRVPNIKSAFDVEFVQLAGFCSIPPKTT